MASVVIGADICPIEINRPYFEQGDAETLFGDLLPEFRDADLAIANLECPLIEKPSPIVKTGPTFGESSRCINGIREAGIRVLNLANNHIMDHGEAGLRNTLRVCEEAGIATVGAGKNLDAARRILVRETNGLRIGVLAMAEHEFSIATATSWGANPLDPIDFVRNVKQHRDEFDYLVVLLHGGHEFYPHPSPRIKKVCRFMIEMGADFVAVQHAHCLGGHEAYRQGRIVYGQGAIVMDEAVYRKLDTFREGYLVKLTIESNPPARMEIVPLRQSKDGPGARKLTGKEAERFLSALAEKSDLVRDDVFLEKQWHEFCESHRSAYLSAVLGHGRVLRKLNAATRGALVRALHDNRSLASLQNVIWCETHREILATILSNRQRR